jgi:hypothetical protein
MVGRHDHEGNGEGNTAGCDPQWKIIQWTLEAGSGGQGEEGLQNE